MSSLQRCVVTLEKEFFVDGFLHMKEAQQNIPIVLIYLDRHVGRKRILVMEEEIPHLSSSLYRR